MRMTVKCPRLGETAELVLVVEWLAEPGAVVTEGTAIMLVETDKVETEVTAPVAGTLVEQCVKTGDEVRVGQPIAVFEG